MKYVLLLFIAPFLFFTSCKKEEECVILSQTRIILTINDTNYVFNNCKAYDLDSTMNIFFSDDKPYGQLNSENFRILYVPKQVGKYQIDENDFPYQPPVADYNIWDDTIVGGNYNIIADTVNSYINITKICDYGVAGDIQLILKPDPHAWNKEYKYYPGADSLIVKFTFAVPFRNP